jgi:cell division protein FtsB
MKKQIPSSISPNQVWLGLFGIWCLILTGVFTSFLGDFAAPGVLQAIRIQNLLHSKNAQLEKIQTHINELQAEADAIEKSPVAQQREIRRILGYAAADEIIFEFGSSNVLDGRTL